MDRENGKKEQEWEEEEGKGDYDEGQYNNLTHAMNVHGKTKKKLWNAIRKDKTTTKHYPYDERK